MKILVVEDNTELNEAVVRGLKNRNYTVDNAFDGKEGKMKVEINDYDLIVLDLNLPHKDGIEVARELRDGGNYTPIIALTARDRLIDKLDGFEVGFDDYLTKPFEFKELAARIEAIIRRSKPNKQVILKYNEISLDPKKRISFIGDDELELTRYEFNLLEYLLRNKGNVVKNSDLIEHIWGEDSDLLNPPIRSHIKNLRKKLNDDKFELIETVPGVGYKIG